MKCKYEEEAELVPHYEKHVEYYSTVRPHWIGNVLNELDVDLSNVRRTLDVGCGDGRLAHWLATHHAIEADGVDYSPKRIAKATATAESQRLPCRFVCQDLYYFLDECTRKYDLIAFFEVLEHLVNPMEAIDASRKLLTNGGIIVGSVPLNMPYSAHLQLYSSHEDVQTKLSPTFLRSYQARGARHDHVLCRWDS